MALRSAQRGPGGIIIRVDTQVYRSLSRRRGPGRSFNDVLRRLFGLPRKAKWIRTNKGRIARWQRKRQRKPV